MYSEIQNTVHVSGDTVEQIQIQFGWEVGADDGWLRSFKTCKGLDWVLKLTELDRKQTGEGCLALPSFPVKQCLQCTLSSRKSKKFGVTQL